MEDFNYKLIDLGLPSGTLWMDRNLGASSPEDAGLYFAWGETQGYTVDEAIKLSKFDWSNYKFGTEDNLTKYNSTDGLTTLETTDDTVLQNVHKCTIPTKEQIQELIDETTSILTTQNGVSGRLFTSKTNSNSIFVPAAGDCYSGSFHGVGFDGYLWSNSLGEGSANFAWSFNLYSKSTFLFYSNRCFGHSVRGVKNKD